MFQLIAEELLSRPGALAALAASASAQDLALQEQRAALKDAENGSSHGGDEVVYEDAGGRAHAQAPASPRAAGGAGCAAPGGVIPCPNSGPLTELYKKLQFDPSAGAIDRGQAAEALSKMGFRLRPSEVAQLVDMMDTSGSGKVRRSAFAASQIDWRHLQQNDVGTWIDIARSAFSSLDKDADGGEGRCAKGGTGRLDVALVLPSGALASEC